MRTALVIAATLTAACKFHVSPFTGGGGGGSDMSVVGDMSDAPDLAGGCVAGSVTCSGDTLVTCHADGMGSDATACALGCNTSPAPHCNAFYPAAPIQRGDFDTTGLVAQNWAMGPSLDSDHGCVGCGATPLRPNNTDPNSYEVHNGIGFHVVSIAGGGKLGVWTFVSLTVASGANIVIFGSNGAALVSAGDLVLDGVVDVTCAANRFVTGGAMPTIAGPGGFAGATSHVQDFGGGTGGGATADSNHGAGGGGAGYGAVGGAGGDNGPRKGGTAGPMAGSATLAPLIGGAGGGAGGENGSGNSAPGGGGGGILVLVAQGTLTVGAGGATGGVNAGGCGGWAQQGLTLAGVGGGGGGAGGAIWLQAPTVHVAPMGVLAANGGGGAAGGALLTTSGANGQAGQLGTTAATGGTPGFVNNGGGGPGGTGGAVAMPGGSGSSTGGGGGGAVGRIRVDARTGKLTLDGGSVVSPTATPGTADVH